MNNVLGFLRITGGKNPLDATSVHPESYEAATKLLEMLGYQLEDIAGGLTGLSLMAKDTKKLAEQVGIGEITLKDIIRELEKPDATRVMRCQNRFCAVTC